MRCRRCYSSSLLVLNRKHPGDNHVVRCRDCGSLFSPRIPDKRPENPLSDAARPGQA